MLVIIAVYKDSESASSLLKVVNFIKLEPVIVHYTSHTVSVQWNTLYLAIVSVQLPNHTIHRVAVSAG